MSQTNCGCEKTVVKVPVRGLEFALDEEALKSIQYPPVSGSGLPVGSIQLLPFRKMEMPLGWYMCDGATYALTSVQGQALNALSPGFKEDWGIVMENDTITMPNLFDIETRGYFFRAVDGENRRVGSVEGDAIRNMTGDFPCSSTTYYNNGVFYYTSYAKGGYQSTNGFNYKVYFDASRVVPTADENRPVNVGMLPAIYLGV